MTGRPPIVLLTDFGLQDPFVGVMKGVILAVSPGARIVDLCHGIPPGDIRSAAFSLMAGARYFPRGSLFVVVVDPGVGSARKILFARSKLRRYLFPDNGVTGWVERFEPFLEVREVTDRRLFLPSVSATFHGRDIFAPVAGRLSLGLPGSRLGPRVRRWARLPFPSPASLRPSGRPKGLSSGCGRRSRLAGEVLVVDRFGNAVTSLPAALLGHGGVVTFRGREIGAVRSSYSSVPPGQALAVHGSAGFLELSVRDGDFAKRFKACPGDRVEVSPS